MPSSIQIRKIATMSGHKGAIFALTADTESPSHLLSAAGDGWVVRWDLESPELGKLIAKVDTQLFAMESVAGQNLVVAGDMNGGIHWLYLRSPERNRHISHHQKGVFAIRQFGDFVYTLGGAGLLSKWSVEKAKCVESVQLSTRSLRCLAYSSIRKELAVGASDGHIYLLDDTSLAITRVINDAHQPSVFCLSYTPDSQHLISGGRDAMLTVWDTRHQFGQVHQFAAHLYTINDIAFHPKGHLFATASRDKTIKIWDAGNFELLKVLERVRDNGHANSVNRLYWSPLKNWLISAGDDRMIGIWEIG